MIVPTGITTFQTVTIELARDSQRMPSRFTVTKITMRAMATMMPLVLSVPVVGW